MTINIQLQYHTSWGETIHLRIGKRRVPMQYSFGGLWQIVLTGRDGVSDCVSARCTVEVE